MIKIINLYKAYSTQDLFNDVSFTVNAKERIGLVGRNGHGKSTLLKMIIGDEYPDAGEIVIPRDYRIGHVSQHLHFSQATVIAEGCMGLGEHQQDDKWKVEKILFGLGFSTADMQRSPLEFSGGFQVRLNLAKVLASEPNLLLLDEPTNYLDIVSIRWLANFLRSWSGELMLVTHDRSFMDSVITHTVGIHRKKIRKISGITDKYYEQILKEEEIYEKTRINDEKKRKEVELFISRFRAKARLAGLVQSRVKALDKKEALDKLDKIETLDFSFNYKPFNAKVLVRIEHLEFSYAKEVQLIKNLNLTIGQTDRICVIGKNGKGKSTLLKLLTGELQPVSGEIIGHPNTDIGYYAQTNASTLNDSLTVEEEIMSSGVERQQARNISGAMMFEGDLALKRIGVLSGGEKSRVLLGKLLARSSNLLLLDEPTNHLDMESCDSLLAAIDEFHGAVIMVTHNEMFLHSLANRFIVFQGGKTELFEGSYQDFLERVGWDEEEKPLISSDNGEKTGSSNKKDIRKLRADIISRRSKELKPLENQISTTEESIMQTEAALNDLNTKMIHASQNGDGIQIRDLSKEIHRIQTKIDSLYASLDIFTREFDAKSAFFEKELEDLQ